MNVIGDLQESTDSRSMLILESVCILCCSCTVEVDDRILMPKPKKRCWRNKMKSDAVY
jgi:hypothetical protein